MDAFPIYRAPQIKDAFWPIVIFVSVGILISVGLQLWMTAANSRDMYTQRHDIVYFWTGGLGAVGGLMLAGVAILIFFLARVVDDSLRDLQRDVRNIASSIETTADRVTSGMSIAESIGSVLRKV